MRTDRNFFYSTLICPVCKTRMTIPRKRKRKEGHIKTMYCGICREIRDFEECNSVSLAEREDNGI